jgi:hypothetical protein
MNWEAIGAIGEILGAAVVVATIFYLALQIRQNHSSNQMVAASRIAESADAWLGQIIRDKALHDIYQNGLRDYDSLERSDQGRFILLIAQFLRSIEGAWTHEQFGVLNKDQWYGYKMTIRRIVGSSGGRTAFELVRSEFSPAFCSAVVEIISNNEKSRPLGEKV